MNRRWGVLVAVGLVLTGCQTGGEAERAVLTGNYGSVAGTARDESSFAALDTSEVYNLCDAYLKFRRYEPFFTCHDVLTQRVAAKDGYIKTRNDDVFLNADPAGNYMNRPYGQFYLKILKAEALLGLGRNAEALTLAFEADRLAVENQFVDRPSEDNRELMALFTLGVSEGQRGSTNTLVRARSLGVVGMAAARVGDTARAQDAITALKELDTGGFFTRATDSGRRHWLARVQYDMGDFAGVVESLEGSGKVGAGGALWEILVLHAKLNPIAYPLYAAYGMSPQTWEFVQGFEGELMLNRARLRVGKVDQAKAGFQEILAEPRSKDFGELHYLALHGLAESLAAQGDYATALGLFRQSADVIEAQRSSINIDAYKVGFAGDKTALYADAVEAAVAAGDAAAALEFAERAKGRALVDLLAQRTEMTKGRRDPVQAASLLTEIDRLEKQGLQATAAANGATLRAAALDKLSAVDAELASLVAVRPVPAEKIQLLLGADETLLEFFFNPGADKVFAVMATRDKITAKELEAPGLEREVVALREALRRAKGETWRRHAAALFDMLIRPVSGELRTGMVSIVPHGALHYLPFAALWDGSGYLMDRHKIRLLPSANVLPFLKMEGIQSDGAGLLIFGNPDLGDPKFDLPGAQRESMAIRASFDKAHVLLRDVATESAFKRTASGFGMLHLASHGEFVADDPLSSRLLLAPGDGDDGSLTVPEIYGLALRADLVTLSACETGLGDVSTGDDVVGLNRGFLYAGARGIVSSLWSVSDDATEALMRVLYAELGKGASHADALRQAQIETRRRFEHPFYWAAFQLTGG
ncbi:MAG: CHAT domain-containing protein [Alphaproteobacteria bacterium]|nr:CHAT domain-containing protein [Alphaproteobacteria bacterium]MBO6865267.1 CHAT domain-containing protein [Alphaproteobacteria bacterium]